MWEDIDIEYLGRYGYELPPELQKDIEGMSLSETAVYFKERFSIPESLEEIKSTWMDMARDKYTNKVPLKPGAREFLVWLRQQGIRTGIASSNGIELVETVLKAQGIQEYLCLLYTSNISTNREGSAAEHSPCLCYTGQSTKRGKSQGKKVTEGQVHRRSTNKGDSGSHFRESGEK